MNGVAMTTSSDVEKFAHTSSGIRKKLIPGARIVMIVTRKFSAVAIDDAPANCTPIVKKTWPMGCVVDNGAYAVQPAANEPPGARNDSSIMHAGDRQHPERQRVEARERHVRRADHERQDVVRQPGEDRDDEQEDQERRVDAEEAVERVRRRRTGGPAAASSARMSIAIRPPTNRKKNEVTTYCDADDLVVGVDLEVVLPRVRAVVGVVLRARLAARPPSRTSSRSSRCRRGTSAARRAARPAGRPRRRRAGRSRTARG